ncbi:uncharacterized protein [Drosophila kikkawai]|nr:pollen-specific leucine-rich repeat extensin-like protein 2 isoform X3 [Drosophila kikkawai]
MSNLCRSFKKPCPCARSRFGWQMSNRATMPETWRPAENSNPCSNHFRGMPIKNRRRCGGQVYEFPNNCQDFPREYERQDLVQEYTGQPCQEYQEYGNYGSQQAPCNAWEPCRYLDTQPPPPPQRFYCQQPPQPPQRCCGQSPPPPPHRCCEPPSQRCCGQSPPPEPNRCYEPPPQRCCGQSPPPDPHRCCEPPPQRCCGQSPPPEPHRSYEPPPQRCYGQPLPPSPPPTYCGQPPHPPPPTYYCQPPPSPPPTYCGQTPPQTYCGQPPPPPPPPPSTYYCQPPPSPPQTYCGQPPPPERCYEPPQRCCCQDNPPPCQDRNPCECRDTRRRKRRCCRRKKGCSSESLCVVTHEVSVQTEGDPCKPADLIEIVDVTTQEKEVRHRTGEVELTVDEVQTVTVVPGDGSKATRNQVQSHISSRDSSKADNSQRVQRQFEQEVDPTSVEVPTKAMRYSELEPMMENIKDIPSVASSGSASPSEVKEHRVYRTNTKFEHDFGINSGKKETKTFLDDTHDVKDSKQKSSAGSRTPLNRPAPKRSTKIGPPSSKEGLTTRQRKTNTIDTGIRRPISK